MALPSGYSKEHAPYPVLYAADANAEFCTVVETARALAFEHQIPDLVVVGIGYPNSGQGFAASNADRTLDLTPSSDPRWIAESAKESAAQGLPPATASGGAATFLSFIRNDLAPAIGKNYNVSHEDRAWFGHSFGGLFGIYAMLHNDGLFHRFIIGSPSIWWNQRSILVEEKSFAESRKQLRARLFLSAGSEEEKEFTSYAMVSNLQAFVDTLRSRKYAGLEIQSHIFEGESHLSVVPATISKGLRSIYAKSNVAL